MPIHLWSKPGETPTDQQRAERRALADRNDASGLRPLGGDGFTNQSAPATPAAKSPPAPKPLSPTEQRKSGYSWYRRYAKLPLLQRIWALKAIPFSASAAMHAVTLVAIIALVPPLVSRLTQETHGEPLVIPDTTLVNGDFGGVMNPGMGQDPTRTAAQVSESKVADTQGWAQRESQTLASALRATGETDDIARGQSAADTGQGKESTGLAAVAQESGGSLSTFGPKGGGQGLGPKSRMFGMGGNVRSVVYICDWSGSLVGSKQQVLVSELNTVVASLSPLQAFNVLVFQERLDDGSHFWAFSRSLMMATPNNKTRVFGFLNGHPPRGSTNPIPALEEAFREKPELIFLLTDGDFDNPSSEQVMARINDLNQEKKTHVNTILLLGTRDERYDRFEQTMNQIATENGGVYRKFYCDEFSP